MAFLTTLKHNLELGYALLRKGEKGKDNMRKNGIVLFVFIFVIVFNVKVYGKTGNDYRALPCKALVDSVKNIAKSDTNIENIEGKASLFMQAIVAKRDTSLPYLSEAIKDPARDWKLRFVSVEMLSQISQSDSSAKILAAILSDKKEHPYLRGVCAFSLGGMGKKEYAPLLIQNLQDKSIYVKERTIWGLDLLKDSRAIQPLIGCLDDSYYMVQILAIQALGYLKAKEAIEPLKRKLEDKNVYEYKEIIQRHAITAIANIGGAEGDDFIFEILKEPKYGKLRINAIKGLADTNNKKIIPYLIQILDDKDELLRVYAGRALAKMQVKEAITPIKQAISTTKSRYAKEMLEKSLAELNKNNK